MLNRNSPHYINVEPTYRIPAGLSSQAKDAWAVDWAKKFWRCGARASGDYTPWHPDLQNRMFYL